MRTLTRPISATTAGDLMSRDILQLSEDTPLREAARQLADAQISGAPVVDRRGRIVGVLSSTDFMKHACHPEYDAAESDADCRPACAQHHDYFVDWQVVEVESLPSEAVRRYMSRDVVTVDERTKLPALARRMVESHIHRVVVVDDDHAPIGIVTSTDILAAVAGIGS